MGGEAFFPHLIHPYVCKSVLVEFIGFWGGAWKCRYTPHARLNLVLVHKAGEKKKH